MRSFASLAVAVGAVLTLASSSALAGVRVPGTSATFGWTPPSGPVESYQVYVARNVKNFKEQIETQVSEPQVTVTGEYGEKLHIRVTACNGGGACSQPSESSVNVKFVDPNGADKGSKGADKGSKGADKGSKGADKGSKGADKGSKGADKGSKSTERGSKRADGGSKGAGASTAAVAESGTGDGWNGAYGGSSQPPPASSAQGTMPYDFNGDGRTDLLWQNLQANAVAIWLMNGTSPSQIADLGTLHQKWGFVGSGDFDGDGYADLLLRNSAQRKSEIWFIEEGGVQNAVSLDDPGDGWTADAIGDFDGDGYADLLWRKGEKSLFWFMRGSIVDEAVFGPSVQELLTAECAPELDGDGRSDLSWSGGRETVAWLMDGSSPWRSGPAGPPMNESLAIGCGDADGDGVGDVLWYDPESRLGTLWAMDGDLGMDQSFELPQLQAGWAIEASGDFDGDGLANEIALRNANSGEIEIWELQWNSSLTSFSIGSTSGAGMGSGDWRVVAP